MVLTRAASRRALAALIALVATLGLAQGLASAHMVDTFKAPKANPKRSAYPTPVGTARTVRYPLPTLKAPTLGADGKHGMAMTSNELSLNIAKPCTGCYITSMQTKLVDPTTGAELNWNNDIVMHHAVLTNASRDDATCGVSLFGTIIGQRFFASGAEHTKVAFPAGYGYKVGHLDRWNLVYELMTMAKKDQPVAIEVTYTHTTSAKPVDPIWLDQRPCPLVADTFSEYRVTGDHTATMTYNGAGLLGGVMNLALGWLFGTPSKSIIYAGGHVHDLGVNTTLWKGATKICESTSGHGENAKYIDHHGFARLSSMSICVGTASNPVVANFKVTDTLKMTTTYAMGAQADDHAMGIMILYVA